MNLINTNGLVTLEGIQKIRDDIKNNEELSQYDNLDSLLEIIYKTIIPNLNLAMQTATSDLLETWEDTSKKLSSAMSGGVSLKDADLLINEAKTLGLE